MRNRILPCLILLALVFFSSSLNAQPPCAFDLLHEKQLLSNPLYAKQIAQNELSIQKYILDHPELLILGKNRNNRPNALYTIPVVVHVMHTGGAIGTIYNPDDAQIIAAIDYLNEVFAGTLTGMTAPVEGGGVVDLEVQFALAQRTPSCGATNGIDRVNASSLTNYVSNGVNANTSGGVADLTLKNFARWNPADYYNIWVVNRIDGADGTSGQFIAGYAYFPGASANLDGTVMLATQMNAGEKTLPHEVGHALNLHHTFNGSNNSGQCPPSGPCLSTGDGVCDTDPVSNNVTAGIYDFSCRTGSANGCPPGVTHTINTESNFMAYTNCYTLFTNGQKARAQAAMSLPSRSSLVSPSNLALTPCGTFINFNQATASRTEDPTGTLSGCRRYRDYTYQLSIGAAPSAAASATLTYGGTAIKGLDYDVTTNGNFSSPSDILNFASGSTAAQTFTVRIYDDADVETSQTVIIDFTVNNGGGDAAKGVTTPTFTLTLADNDTAPVGSSSATYSLGTYAGTIIDAPFDARLQRQRGQYLYRASELQSAGMTAGSINSLQLFVDTKHSTRPFANLTIRMAHTNVNNLVDGSLTVVGGMTTVFTSASYATIDDWNSFSLSTPFNWNGSSNIAIEICFSNAAADAGDDADEIGVYFDGGSPTQGNMFFQNGINCGTSFTTVNYYSDGIKPLLRFGLDVSGTPVETTLAGSSSDYHIAAGSNDYFYSSNNRLLLRLSSVNATLDCVNASLNEAGAVWSSYQGGERSAKVFTVTPTSNAATTDYTIALYFTNTELAGKNPATLRLAKTTAASVAASNSSNTVLLTPTVTTLGSGTTVFTASFTGFSQFFLVDAAVTLPVNLTVFTGRLTAEQNTVLNWETSSEYNNKQFEVEGSTDGINFNLLGTVASQGNAASRQQYQFIHIQPQAGMNWYRLRQVDYDGQHKYSKVISVKVDKGFVKPSIYPVPAKDIITVNFGSVSGAVSIELLSADMRLLQQEKRTGLLLKKDLHISQLAPGVYFIRLSGAVSEMLRFIKE